MSDADPRESLCEIAKDLHQRGYAHGSTGNLSLRVRDHIIITPTGACLGRLAPGDLAEVDAEGKSVNGKRPSKEWPFHPTRSCR